MIGRNRCARSPNRIHYWVLAEEPIRPKRAKDDFVVFESVCKYCGQVKNRKSQVISDSEREREDESDAPVF